MSVLVWLQVASVDYGGGCNGQWKMHRRRWRRLTFLATFDTFYPRKCYTPFSASHTPNIFASLFSMPDNQSILKISWVYRFCSLFRVGLDVLKMRSVVHVAFTLSHFTHTSALASAFFDFRSLYMTFAFSHIRILYPCTGARHYVQSARNCDASSPAAGLVWLV